MRTVLVVDDHPDARDSMAGPLSAAGFDVRETATGRDALQLARRLRADMIVLDISLPDMAGYEVLRRLKADPATSSIPVILKTAGHREDERPRELEAGAAAYFMEPFDPQALIAVVRRVLGEGASGSPSSA